MNPPAGTIDLGELPRGGQVELDAPWPVRGRLRRWRGRHASWQAAGAATVVALAIGTVAASAAPGPPAFSLQFTVHAMSFELDDENLYVVDRTEPQSDPSLMAYRLSDGALRWENDTLPGLGTNSWVYDWQGPLLVVDQLETGDSFWPQERTVHIDRETGRSLWRRGGFPLGVFGSQILLAEAILTEEPIGEDFQPPVRITAVDFATGAQHWSIDLPEGARYQPAPGPPGRLLTMPPDGGRLTSYDLTTGELAASVPLDAQVEQPELVVAGSLAIVMSSWQAETEPSWAAYDVDTLTLRWTRGLEDGLDGWPYPCGAFICFNGIVPGAIDPATGATRWSLDWVGRGTDGWFDLQGFESGQLANHLLLTQSEGDNPRQREHHWLIDAVTGEPVLDLGEWKLPLIGFWQAVDAPELIPSWSSEERLWLGRLRPDLSGIDPVAALETPLPAGSPYHDCTAWPTRVVCATEMITRNVGVSGWNLAVWQLHGGTRLP